MLSWATSEEVKLDLALSIVAITNVRNGRKKSTITVLSPTRKSNEMSWIELILNMSPETPVESMCGQLVERNHLVTEDEAKAMAEATDRGEETGMNPQGSGNFFFTKNGNGGISLVRIGKGSEWVMSVKLEDLSRENDIHFEAFPNWDRILVKNYNVKGSK